MGIRVIDCQLVARTITTDSQSLNELISYLPILVPALTLEIELTCWEKYLRQHLTDRSRLQNTKV